MMGSHGCCWYCSHDSIVQKNTRTKWKLPRTTSQSTVQKCGRCDSFMCSGCDRLFRAAFKKELSNEAYPFESMDCPACHIPELYIDHAFEPQLGSSIMEEEDVVVEPSNTRGTVDIAGAGEMYSTDGKLPGLSGASTPAFATKKPCRGNPNDLGKLGLLSRW